ALSWYFLLEPLSIMRNGESLFGKITQLAYPIGDLGVLFGLVLMLAYCRPIARSVLALLMGAIACLAFADSWSASVTIRENYLGGNLPDLFWMACYFLLPLAALVHLRGVQRTSSAEASKALADSLSVAPPESALVGS